MSGHALRAMGIGLPGRLPSAPAGWSIETDVVVIGSGVAGLTTALTAADAGARVVLLTKGDLSSGSTAWAQGGVAVALGEEDSPEDHLGDTLIAGAGLCDEPAVRILVSEGPAAVARLMARGAHFDTDAEGIALTREGGHRRRRIVHAGGDATGAEISRALTAAVRANPGIEVWCSALALDAVRQPDGSVTGVRMHVVGQGRPDGIGEVSAGAVVLATGGCGAVFSQTTNPATATGDGLALALRAGAAVADMEFIQFHPTVLWVGYGARGSQPLVSEAVRGEGAVLRAPDGSLLMAGRHPQADLAPRDVVAAAIAEVIRATGSPHVWLDGTQLGSAVWQQRFPTILASCRSRGIDPVTEWIPVVPAAHYFGGGVQADMSGRTSVPGLYAVGECACTGVHGANRLASNSLLEGLVVGERLGELLGSVRGSAAAHRQAREPDTDPGYALDPLVFGEITRLTTDCAGVQRGAEDLRTGLRALSALRRQTTPEPVTPAWETTNAHTVSTFILAAALERTESRGTHRRRDFPESAEGWRTRLVGRIAQGEPAFSAVPVHLPGPP